MRGERLIHTGRRNDCAFRGTGGVALAAAATLGDGPVESYTNMADILARMGRVPEAAARYQQALSLRPADPELHQRLAYVQLHMELIDEAEASYREALRLSPNHPDPLNGLGLALARKNRLEDAIAAYKQALDVRPDFAEAHNNLGNALRCSSRPQESIDCYLKALEIRPDFAEAHNNLGSMYDDLGRFEEAMASYTRCLQIRPNFIGAHMNLAFTWLRRGDYARGWAEYAWRLKNRAFSSRPSIMPEWDGSPLAGRRILLVHEQGLGDTIQFARFALQFKRQGAGAVILQCPEKLIDLLSRSPGIDRLVPQGQAPPDHDVYCYLMSIPGLMAMSVDAIPAEVPYIFPDPDLIGRWRCELAGVSRLKVGIIWQGNPRYAADRDRSIPLIHFEPLARVPGVQLFSLQKNDGIEQLDDLAGRFPITDLGCRLDGTTGLFPDTAAVLENLDLCVCCDTAAGHLAGALGVPVWVALPTFSDWRWMIDRTDTPWYPTMRLFRQEEPGVWGPVFERMASELRALASARIPTPSAPVGITSG
jgi:tetratricopeptide (TPR) repeat protein